MCSLEVRAVACYGMLAAQLAVTGQGAWCCTRAGTVGHLGSVAHFTSGMMVGRPIDGFDLCGWKHQTKRGPTSFLVGI